MVTLIEIAIYIYIYIDFSFQGFDRGVGAEAFGILQYFSKLRIIWTKRNIGIFKDRQDHS